MRAVKSVAFAGKTMVIVGDDQDWYFQGVEQHVLHNSFLAPVLKHHVHPGSTILDIGANVGVTTALAAFLVDDAEIVSVEPSPAYDYLVETVRQNNIARHRAIRCCMGSYVGEVSFVAPASNSSASHMIEAGNQHDTDNKVRITTVDSLVAELGLSRLDLVKIDVEGHELGVLDGMAEASRRFEPLVFMEFNSYALTALANVSPRSVLDRIMAEYGCFFTQSPEGLRRVATTVDCQSFLHTNMLQHNCVDDILFTRSAERASALGV